MAAIKLKGAETNLASATNLEFATLVRLVNNSSGIQVVTHADKDGQVKGTFTMTANSVELVKKTSTDTLVGAATTLAVKVASTW
jgi:redox-regulated HSP33 family molecular chaperone